MKAGVVHGRRDDFGRGRTEALPQVDEVAVRVAVGRDPLVGLEHRHMLPGDVLLCEPREHRPWRVPPADGERESAVGLYAGLGQPPNERRRSAGDRIGVGDDPEFVMHSPQPFFSACPPNSERIAERILSVNSPDSLDSKRS